MIHFERERIRWENMLKIRYRIMALVVTLAVLFSVLIPMEEVQAAETGRVSIKAKYDYKMALRC